MVKISPRPLVCYCQATLAAEYPATENPSKSPASVGRSVSRKKGKVSKILVSDKKNRNTKTNPRSQLQHEVFNLHTLMLSLPL